MNTYFIIKTIIISYILIIRITQRFLFFIIHHNEIIVVTTLRHKFNIRNQTQRQRIILNTQNFKIVDYTILL